MYGMTRNVTALLLATFALAAAGCGSDDDESGSTSAGNGVDRAFVADMVPHHESAVAMAKIGQQRGESPFVKQLADDIVRTQNEEIRTLKSEDAGLADAGVKKGTLGVPMGMMGMSDTDVGSLKTAEPFDKAFIAMMLPHHVGAVAMAKAEIAKGADPELKQLAEAIITAQEREIREMRAQG